jgi:hypothetical protein
MKTLKQLSIEIEELLKKHPESADLPVIYKGTGYHKIHFDITLVEIHDIKNYYLELVGFLGEEGVDIKNINGVCIN